MAFRRAAAPAAPAGTRRGLDGLLTSSGHAALDAALGGGLPLGALVLLEEDARGGARLASTLGALFCAQGIAAGHALLVGGADGRAARAPRALLAALPFCASAGSFDAAATCTQRRRACPTLTRCGRFIKRSSTSSAPACLTGER